MKTKSIPLYRFCVMYWMIFLSFPICSQPFIDVLQLRNAFGFKHNNEGISSFTHFWVGCDLPLKVKEETYLLLSPGFEQWHINSSDIEDEFPSFQGVALPVGIIWPINQSKWSLTLLPVVRSMGEKLFGAKTLQIGGATLATVALQPTKKIRFGVYVNTEFFGFYMVPLLGVDWRLDEKNYLFGILPGRFTFEHQWSKKFYGGLTFRSLSNSFRFNNGQFLRLEDTQFSIFLDYYISKNIAITLEPGYGLFRRIRTGDLAREYISEVNWPGGSFIKLIASYRIRL